MIFDTTKSPYHGMRGVKFPEPGRPELDIQPWHPDRYDDGISPNARCLACGHLRKCHVDDGRCNRISYEENHSRRSRCPCHEFMHHDLVVTLKKDAT